MKWEDKQTTEPVSHGNFENKCIRKLVSDWKNNLYKVEKGWKTNPFYDSIIVILKCI